MQEYKTNFKGFYFIFLTIDFILNDFQNLQDFLQKENANKNNIKEYLNEVKYLIDF